VDHSSLKSKEVGEGDSAGMDIDEISFVQSIKPRGISRVLLFI
jgi:hypothetical protein